MSLVQTLLIILVAFFAYMHSFVGSTMHNRPIVIAPLVGLIMGDLTAGITIGATLELVFMGAFPVGASNPPDFVSGSIISTAFIIATGQDISAAVVLAIPIATLVLLIDNFQMTFLLTWASHAADKCAEQGDIKGVERWQLLAGIGNKVLLSLIVGLGFYLGVPVIEKILAMVPAFVITGLDVAAGIIPAIGFAMLARMMLSKKTMPFLLLGFILAAYFNMPIIGIALLGIVIVWIFINSQPMQKEVIVHDNEF